MVQISCIDRILQAFCALKLKSLWANDHAGGREHSGDDPRELVGGRPTALACGSGFLGV